MDKDTYPSIWCKEEILTNFRTSVKKFPHNPKNKEHRSHAQTNVHNNRKNIFLIKQSFSRL